MPIYALGETSPQFADSSTGWIAPDAVLIGRLHIGRDVGIWFGSVLRGDNEPITIGDGTNVQEHTVMHTDLGFPLTVGRGCTIGHRALLHGCIVGDNALIGMGATVLNGARIGDNSLVGAGALVTEGKEFPAGVLILGSPAKVVRELTKKEVATLRIQAAQYVENANRFRNSLSKIG